MKPSKMLSRFMGMLSEGLSKPMTGYVRDMTFGISVGRSIMLSDIGRSLEEDSDLITTEMRLSRNVVLFAYLAYGFLCLFARKAGKTAMRLALGCYKSFTPNAPPHFIYYRLAHALAAIFLSEGPPGGLCEDHI